MNAKFAPALSLLFLASNCAISPRAAETPPSKSSETAPEPPLEREQTPSSDERVVDGGDSSAADIRQDSGSRKVSEDEVSETPSPQPIDPSPALPEGTKALHIGDSFAGALGRPLSTVFEAAGMKSVLKHTDASYLTDWAWDGKLQKYIWKYNPDLIIVTLGANELEIGDPARREKTVKKIISTIGDIPCVWVAIPLWDGPKNGLLDVIKEHSSPCVYMDTNALMDTSQMPRIHDGIHPTTAARKAWADDVALWLRQQRKPKGARPWDLR